jgi:hypothetical protein
MFTSMRHRRLGAMLAILTTGAGLTALAGSAQADFVPTVSGTVVDNDPLTVSGTHASLEDGNVAFEWGRGNVSSRITGTVHVGGSDRARFRVKVDSYDRYGDKVGTAYDVTDGTYKGPGDTFPVDMEATSAPYIQRVVVSVQKKPDTKWITQGSNDLSYLTLHDDEVQILGTGIDLGGAGFDHHAPTGSATVSYAIGDDGKLTETFRGYLHVEDSYPASGRIEIRALNPLGGFELDSAASGTHTPDENGQSETLSVETSSDNKLEVAMQAFLADPATGAGSWQDVGTQSVSVAE